MALTVNFRVVGVYGYFENLMFLDLSPQSTVQQVMDKIADTNANFSYHSGGAPRLVDKIQYTFDRNSKAPPNSTFPFPGTRSIENAFPNDQSAQVLQYYRSVKGKLGGQDVELALPTQGQPPFSQLPLNSGMPNVPGFTVAAYTLTWRLVEVPFTTATRSKFLSAKLDVLNSSAQR